MKNISIIGASGYTGRELLKILLRHPNVKVTHVTSENNEGLPIHTLHPELRNLSNLYFEKYDWSKMKKNTDIAFLCLPHGASMEFAKEILSDDKIVIDLSADFRIKNIDVYEKWYVKHTQPALINNAIYGLPEINKEKIKTAKLIANPGCYATSIILGLLPILKNKITNPDSIIVDAKSGVSGAGKKMALMYLYNEENENMLCYNPGKHRHTPEIEEVLSSYSDTKTQITFVPHLAPMTRGILATLYADITSSITEEQILKMYENFYKDSKFVRILKLKEFPQTKAVSMTNFCDIGIAFLKEKNKLIISSAIDNLIKGASGQAVQNMNIICGFYEEAGLL